MKREIQLSRTQADATHRSESRSQRKIREAILTPVVCSLLATLGIFGGIASLFVGIVAVIIHGVLSHDKVFDRIGTVLLVAAIPLILFGSLFVDEIEGRK